MPRAVPGAGKQWDYWDWSQARKSTLISPFGGDNTYKLASVLIDSERMMLVEAAHKYTGIIITQV